MNGSNNMFIQFCNIYFFSNLVVITYLLLQALIYFNIRQYFTILLKRFYNILFLTMLNLNIFCNLNIGSDTLSKTINQFDIKIRICLKFV